MKKIIAVLITLGILSTTVFGDYYEDGEIARTNKEYTKAFELFVRACDGGDSSGCAMVGAFYEDGDGIQRNYSEALSYYIKSCDMGYESGCEFHAKLQAKLPVCTDDELSFINDKRYFSVSGSKNYSEIFADGKTITIDKKNKIIKVWAAFLASEDGRQSNIKSMSNYDNYGYSRHLYVINYGKMKSRLNTFADYNCNGSLIVSDNLQDEWNNIIPGSVLENITEGIIKKYNLK